MKFLGLIMAVVVLAGCSHFSKVQKSANTELKYKKANEYFDKKDYHLAQQLYEELFPLFKGDARFEDLYYKYAYCAFYEQDYMNAENLFKSFVEVFPNSTKAAEMEFMRAYCYYKQSPKFELDQTNTTRAIGLMQTFINTYPNSEKVKEALAIIDKCKLKLEMKEAKSAELYYNIGQYKAAAIAFENLINNYPESSKSDLYKWHSIRAYYNYATHSIEERKEERFEHVIAECNDFIDRFPESELSKQVEEFLKLSQNNIKALKNEQVKTAA